MSKANKFRCVDGVWALPCMNIIFGINTGCNLCNSKYVLPKNLKQFFRFLLIQSSILKGPIRFVLYIVLYIIGYSMLIYPRIKNFKVTFSDFSEKNPTIGESDRKIWNIKSLSLILFKFYLILWKNVNAKIICYTDLISGIVNHIRSRTFARVIWRSPVNWYSMLYTRLWE